MPSCPRCHQKVDVQAIACPYCRTELKAHGHPGITLHRATQQEYLCDTCAYHADDTCNFPQRPFAKECTLYQNVNRVSSPKPYKPPSNTTLQSWLQRNATWIVLGLLVAVSLCLALSGR